MMLPYRDGYRAEINGREAAVSQALGGFIAVELEEGLNQVSLTYRTPGLIPGLLLSLAGVALLLLLLWRSRRLLASSGWVMKAAGILPGIWFTVMIGAFYVLPLLLARGGI